MLFDWFTVLAQIANFLILMWLLKRFLYKPVLDAIDAREKRIADLLNETEQHEQKVEQQQAELSDKNATFASERDGLLAQAKTDAEVVKQKLLDTAAKEVEEQRSQWLSALQKEQHTLDRDISQRTQQEVFHVARKALQDLSGVELETQITQVFIKQLEQMSPQQREQFSGQSLHVKPTGTGMGTDTDAGINVDLVIRSAMPLSEVNQEALKVAVEDAFSSQSVPQITPQFEVDASLVSGIEMVGSGHKISWNIDNYLSGLEESIASLVDSKIGQGHTSDSGEANV